MSKFKHRQLLIGVLAASVAGGASASSHREAPFISTRPSVDGTDFYMFNSYEQGRAGFRDAGGQLCAAARSSGWAELLQSRRQCALRNFDR